MSELDTEWLMKAKKHEEVFRNILRSRRINEEGLTIDEIYRKYSDSERPEVSGFEEWRIFDFQMGPTSPSGYSHIDNLGPWALSGDQAFLSSEFRELGFIERRPYIRSRSGDAIIYQVNQDKTVKFERNIRWWLKH